MSCTEKPDGSQCPELKDNLCNDFQLTETQARDGCFVDSVVNESLDIAGADAHVFKLLGVHEQGLLIDLTGNGVAISSGAVVGFEAANAFTSFMNEWRSVQTGSGVIASSYIGYDFGEFKLDNGRDRYGVETFIKHNIATLKIKQSSQAKNRATKIRIERSNDGVRWYGVSIVNLADDDTLQTVKFKHSVPSRWWRLRPVTFNGGATDYWGVQALQLMDYNETSIDDIQDEIFLENRDRDYADETVTLKVSYDLIDIQTELTKFGIELPSQSYYMQVNFNACVQRLGRPLVIGDVFELPSETQYSPTMEPIKKYLEVTDVGWSTEGYTPGWQPTMLRIVAQPMLGTQETQDIFGGLAGNLDATGLFDIDDGNHPILQDISNAAQTIEAEDTTNVPERGRDFQDVKEFSEEQIQSAADQGVSLTKIGLNPKALYVEDGLPPNGEDYTEGDEFPSTPQDGDYHRLTYTYIQQARGEIIPPRLFRWSVTKNRWIYLETDKRQEFNTIKPRLQEFLQSTTAVPPNEIE